MDWKAFVGAILPYLVRAALLGLGIETDNETLALMSVLVPSSNPLKAGH